MYCDRKESKDWGGVDSGGAVAVAVPDCLCEEVDRSTGHLRFALSVIQGTGGFYFLEAMVMPSGTGRRRASMGTRGTKCKIIRASRSYKNCHLH